MSNLSNIELYNNQLASKDSVDSNLLEHCTVQYKYYIDKQLDRSVQGWRVYNLRCNYCDKTVRSADAFTKHIETCKGLEDDYVPKSKRINPKGFV